MKTVQAAHPGPAKATSGPSALAAVRGRLLLVLAVLLAPVGVGCGAEPAPTANTADSGTSVSASSSPDNELRAAYVALRQREGVADSRYHALRAPGGFVTENAARGLTARFDADAITVRRLGAEQPFTLRTTAFRCNEATRLDVDEAVAPELGAAPNRIEYRRRLGQAGAVEWYMNGPLGIEQSFRLDQPPCGGSTETSTVSIEVALDGATASEESERTLVLSQGGFEIARYTDPYAVDATGRALPARLSLRGDRLAVEVELEQARFPVEIDPLLVTFQGQLMQETGQPTDLFGSSVAISGSTAIIGASNDDVGGVPSAGSAYVFVKAGTRWNQQAQLVASDPQNSAYFGISASLSGDTAFVGAYQASAGYVFVRSGTTWTQQARLTSSDGAGLGTSVSVSGDTAVAGAPSANSFKGAAYVYVRSGTTWNEQARLVASDGAASDLFGWAVATEAGTTLVGARSDQVGANAYQGSAYVFAQSGTSWSEQQKLTASDGAGNHEFGRAVALDSGVALVGSSLAGGAYVFTRSGATFSQQAKLSPADGAPFDRFGASVSLSGATALVGSYQDTVGSVTEQGSAYTFVRSGTTWTEQAKLTAGDGASGDWYGLGVALGGDTALVGAAYDDIGANADQGSAYVITRSGTTWTQQQKVLPGDGEPNDYFGRGIALSGNEALVGAPFGGPIGGVDPGAAYVFVRSGGGWELESKITAAGTTFGSRFGYAVSFDGTSALIGAFGDPVGANSFQGSAYVFVRSGSGWAQQGRLVASDGVNDEWFGFAVAIDSATAAVGAQYAGGVQNRGAVYMYARNGTSWSEQQKIPGASGDNLGASVSVSGTTVLMGATGSSAGYAWVRSGTTWSQQQRLTGSDSVSLDMFGTSVSLRADDAVVGASWSPGGVNAQQGAAYVFSRTGTTWNQLAKLTASDGSANDHFGAAVSIVGSTVLIGAPDDETGGNLGQGSAYVFVGSGTAWSEQPKLLARDGAADDHYGSGVALDSATALVSAPFDDVDLDLDQGSAHVYALSGLAGQSCASTTNCASGYTCIDGVCCTTGCTGACEVCAASLGAVRNGTCTALPAGTPGSPACAGSVLCDGVSGSCPSGCNSDAMCANGNYCTSSGTCVASKPNGQACDPIQDCKVQAGCHVCASSYCVDGVCCNEACSGQCEACKSGLSVGTSGTCAAAVAGTTGTPGCTGGVLCDGVARSCPGGCTADGQCLGGNYCDLGSGACLPKKATGLVCTGNNQCTTGQCVDGVCCADACSGLCQACAAALKTAGPDGQCGNAKAGTDPHNQCALDSPTTCNQTGECDGSGACAYYGPSTVCGTPVCVGNESRPRTCAGQFTCSASANGTSCSPYRCQAASGICLTSCSADTDCIAPNYCELSTSTCVGQKAVGSPCTGANECLTSFCVDGVCCDTLCNGSCQACSAALKESASDSGACGPARVGSSDPGCTATAPSSCGETGLCDAYGACALHVNTSCGPTTCDGNGVRGKVCDGFGTCIDAATAVDCAPYVCDGATGGCASPCDANADCQDPSGYHCANPSSGNGACVAKRAIGDACSSAVECLSGFCADGVCCDSACTGQCEWCASSVTLGQCRPAPQGDPLGGRTACAGSGTQCGGACDGAKRDGCVYPGAATECAPPSCQNDALVPARQCDGTGQCAAATSQDCGDYTCKDGSCLTSCATTADCKAGASCAAATSTCTTEGATCPDLCTVEAPDGTLSSCGGYHCVAGACQQQCSTSADCCDGYACQGSQCVASDAGAAGTAGATGAAGAGGAAGGVGSAGTGGSAATGGGTGSGGTTGNAGSSGSGGAAATGAAPSGGTGGTAVDSGISGKKGSPSAASEDEGGCGCRTANAPNRRALFALVALLGLVRRRRAQRTTN